MKSHYTQRIEAIRSRYEVELLRRRLWAEEKRRKYDAFEASEDEFRRYPDQLLVNVYGKAVRKLRAAGRRCRA